MVLKPLQSRILFSSTSSGGEQSNHAKGGCINLKYPEIHNPLVLSVLGIIMSYFLHLLFLFASTLTSMKFLVNRSIDI